MQHKSNHFMKLAALLLTFLFFMGGCDDHETFTIQEYPEVNVGLPPTIYVVKGVPITLKQNDGAVSENDILYFESSGQYIGCTVEQAAENSFTFKVPSGLEDGVYKVYIKQGLKRMPIGSVQIRFITKDIKIDDGTTIYGVVETEDGSPLEGVVVSDGLICTLTDSNGVYQLKSNKKHGVVFYSVPSGYEAENDGVFPKIYEKLIMSDEFPEYHSFKVRKVGSQDNFKLLLFGDMHLAKRSNDLEQFRSFADDVSKYRAKHSEEKIYAATLGDLSWDQHWSKGYDLTDFVNTANSNFKDLILYNVIGNHDHDPNSIASNFDATNPFLTNVAPAWYSFNIGAVHFVVIDDIDCEGYDGIKDRPYKEQIYGDQIEWFARDISYIDPSMPVYVLTHCPIFLQNANMPDNFYLYVKQGGQELLNILKGREVHFVTGHMHEQHTMLPTDVPAKDYGFPVYEHNIPAVCADWWYSGYYTPGAHVCTDGTPAGYAIFDFKGKEMKWSYKGTGRNEKELFRAYDMNNVDFTYALSGFKNLTNKNVINEFTNRYVTPYSGGKLKNKVLINFWNWNSDCKIEVKTKEGQLLVANRYKAYDPLSILALTIPYWDRNELTSVPGTATTLRQHFFLVDCPDEETDLIITATDKFGNVYSFEMQRPYAFNANQYKVK